MKKMSMKKMSMILIIISTLAIACFMVSTIGIPINPPINPLSDGNNSSYNNSTVDGIVNYTLSLNFDPESPFKGDNITVNAEAIPINTTASNDTVYHGDYVIFTVTDPNGIESNQTATFNGTVASLVIPNAIEGNYTVSALAYDSDNGPINGIIATTTISVVQRSYGLDLRFVPEGDNIIVTAEANGTVNPGDYVIFTVTDPNGIESNQTATFNGTVASLVIRNVITGKYLVKAVAYSDNGEVIDDSSNEIEISDYGLDLSIVPEDPKKGDSITVTAEANETVNPGDYVIFTVTDPNGIKSNQTVYNFTGVASLVIPNAIAGNYTVNAVAYNGNEKIYGSDTEITISVRQRSYGLIVDHSPKPPQLGKFVYVSAIAIVGPDYPLPGDYVNFIVTEPNGFKFTERSSLVYNPASSDYIASFGFKVNQAGHYHILGLAYDKNGEAIQSPVAYATKSERIDSAGGTNSVNEISFDV